ncbi:hypothetical protein JOF56_011582 [Kibdelosporangium banguiense]|uniref:DUF397 domain-containing protein n=1 Tax=Kibdelosporangium banguiense TaxID=1365924 RepID=A0ABS4U3E7_9PSEU|nr:DUF397 domain-containing protein [Kibdelosporangium banguiense]MBP2331197.1 hypothetical protein [Kibdelosporangium banguiense]
MDHSGLVWRKSTHSSEGSGGDCVELACLPFSALVRDSKNPTAGTLTIPVGPWTAFLAALR